MMVIEKIYYVFLPNSVDSLKTEMLFFTFKCVYIDYIITCNYNSRKINKYSFQL